MEKLRISRNLALVVSVLLSMLLAGCSLIPSQQSKASTTIPAASPTATSNVTPADPPDPATDWTTYHQNNSRTGDVANVPDPQKLSQVWNKQLDGAVYAEPLVVGGRVIVATENDTLYAFDGRTGNQLWHTNVGTPVDRKSVV